MTTDPANSKSVTMPLLSVIEPDPLDVAHLHQTIGRSLSVYQCIEVHLKILLPHAVRVGEHASSDSFKSWRTLLDSKETLGPLLKLFAEKTRTPDRTALSRLLGEIVTNRNELVHNFYWLHRGKLQTKDDFEAAQEFLNARLAIALPLFETLERFSVEFLSELQREQTRRSAELGSGAGA